MKSICSSQTVILTLLEHLKPKTADRKLSFALGSLNITSIALLSSCQNEVHDPRYKVHDPNTISAAWPSTKNTIFDVKTFPRSPDAHNFIFFQKSSKLAITIFGPRCFLEASKSLPTASRDSPRSRSRALKRHPRASRKLHAASQEPSQKPPRAVQKILL